MRKGEMTREEFERNAGHAAPFLVPVPLSPPGPAPVTPLGQVICTDGWALGSFAGCAAVCSPPVLSIVIRGDDQRIFTSAGRRCGLYHRIL
jgi:hypothetical protein